MAEIIRKKKPIPSKINATWPVTILTKWGIIKAKSRTITDEGLFVNCGKKLPQNEISKVVVNPSPALSVAMRAKFTFSNLSRTYSGSTSSDRGLSFAKVTDEDRQILYDLMSLIEGKGMETVKRVRIKLHLETDKKIVVRDFGNLNDLRLFMQNLFSLPEIADRRTEMSLLGYTGPERRIPI